MNDRKLLPSDTNSGGNLVPSGKSANQSSRMSDAEKRRLLGYSLAALDEDVLFRNEFGDEVLKRARILGLRLIDREDMQNASTLLGEISDYEAVVTTRMYRLPGVALTEARFTHKVAYSILEYFRKLNKYYPDSHKMPDELIRKLARNFVSDPRWSTDPAFLDLFLLFFRPENTATFIGGKSALRDLIRGLYVSPEFKRLRQHTVDNVVLSAMAAINVLEQEAENGDFSEFGSNMKSDMDSEEEGDGEGEDGDGEGQGEEEGEGEGEGEGEQAVCGSSKSQDANTQKIMSRVVDEMNDVMSEEQDRKERESVAGQFAGTEFVDPRTSLIILRRMEDAINTLTGNQSNADRILDQLFTVFGRLSDSFSEALTNARVGTGDVVDVEQGRSLTAMCASEYVYLTGDPDDENDPMFDMFVKKYASGELLMQTRRGLDDAGNGPLIIFLDCSGSMESKVNLEEVGAVQTIIAAGSLCMSLINHAKKTRRRCMVVPFNGAPVRSRITEFEFDRKSYTLDLILSMLTQALAISPDGGTDFYSALSFISNLLATDKRKGVEYESADIVFFSDGLDQGRDEDSCKQIRSKFAMGTRFYGLFVVGGYGYSSTENYYGLFDYYMRSNGSDLTKVMAEFYATIAQKDYLHTTK